LSKHDAGRAMNEETGAQPRTSKSRESPQNAVLSNPSPRKGFLSAWRRRRLSRRRNAAPRGVAHRRTPQSQAAAASVAAGRVKPRRLRNGCRLPKKNFV